MDFKKILKISMLLMVLCISLSMASAADVIYLGDIESDTVITSDATHVPIGDGQYNLHYDADIVIDISSMSDADKKLLEDTVKGDNTTLMINMTADDMGISTETYQGMQMSVEGNTLNIKDNGTLIASSETPDVEIESVGIKAADGTLFLTDDD